MKALVFADLHTLPYFLWDRFRSISHQQFDLSIILGDIDILFLQQIKEIYGDKPIIGVQGNHDNPGDLCHAGIENLHGRVHAINDQWFCGLEGCIRYKNETGVMYEQEDIRKIIEGLPTCDVFISHNSPYGIHDRKGVAHEGYRALRSYIHAYEPSLVLHGHQHRNVISQIGETTVVGIYGISIIDLTNKTITSVIDLEKEDGVAY